MSKFVQILIKNSSTLDFSLPVLIELKQRGHDVTVIDLSRKKFVLSSFYKTQIRNYDIKYITREQLFPLFIGSFLKLLDRWEYKIKPVRLNEILNKKSKFGYVLYFLFKNSKSVLFHAVRKVFLKYITNLRYPKTKLTKLLDGCCAIMWDHRSPMSFYLDKYMREFLYNFPGKVVLMPHAPHMRDPFTEIILPITGKLSTNYVYLLPLKWSNNDTVYSHYDADFVRCGYPGLDRSWIQYVIAQNSVRNKNDVLIIMRPFTNKLVSNNTTIDHYVISYEETKRWLQQCKGLISRDTKKVYLKLHPSNSRVAVNEIMAEVGFQVETEILDCDIYSSVAIVDKVFGFYSTTLLIASAFGCKTFCFSTKLVEKSFSDWPILEKVYTDFGVQMIKSKQRKEDIQVAPNDDIEKHFANGSIDFCADLLCE